MSFIINSLNVTSTTLELQGTLIGSLVSDRLRSYADSAASALNGSLDGPSVPSYVDALLFLENYKEWWLRLVRDDPVHVVVETVLLFTILVVIWRGNGSKKAKNFDSKLTSSEKEQLIKDWKSTSLTPPLTDQEKRIVLRNNEQVTTYTGTHIQTTASSSLLLNLSTFDFLCMSVSEDVKRASRETLQTYGCGSCGPRGFYGTIKPHLILEEEFAAVWGVNESIMYSDGASTSSSTVAAFAKRGDLLVIDQGIYEGLLTGVTLSRSNVKTFKHNDMDDLREVLEKIRREDKRLSRNVLEQRRFIVTEAIYRNYGSILPLDKLVALKDEFCFRLIVDESLSFGVLGPNGLGITDLYNLPNSIEITTVSLENALGSVGGMTIGDDEVVDHQRLSGAGYVFSASAPPFVSSASVASLGVIKKDGKEMIKKLKKNATTVVNIIKKIKQLSLTSSPDSPVIFCCLSSSASHESQNLTLQSIASECKSNGVLLVATGDHVTDHLLIHSPPPMLRLTVNVLHTESMLKKAGVVIQKACEKFC
ncbi:hypothetical protein TrST_g9391 [Triparma strigata]|uniref:serine C-palmitoyltransferase n=1 Tax=Triparma strigata TaxID=1606541 RepID=A0A9W7EN39_9STRA|nr:hypothetical protein TrST_g9391 [Triparma strigata]